MEGYSPIPETRDLGFMFYDFDYSDSKDIRPAFFRAAIQEGKILIPEWNSDEVYR